MTYSSFTSVYTIPCVFCGLIVSNGIYVRNPASNMMRFVCNDCVNKEVEPMIAEKVAAAEEYRRTEKAIALKLAEAIQPDLISKFVKAIHE